MALTALLAAPTGAKASLKDCTHKCRDLSSSSHYGQKLCSPSTAVKTASAKFIVNAAADQDPLLVRATRGEKTERAPAWIMRQAGRYLKDYRELAKKHPSFRERSETTDLIVEITLQPWRQFKPDGVILFSDILTPLPAFGIDFEIDDIEGPIISKPITSAEQVKALHPIELDTLSFVGESLTLLRKEVGDTAAVLGFVGSPWTLATYIIEGRGSRVYKNIKCMMMESPEILTALLDHLAVEITTYVRYQIDAGAQCIQIFDSWGGQLPPKDWEVYSKPYLMKIIQMVKESHPNVPLTLYANGSGGLLERLGETGADCIGLDWTIDMADGRRRLGNVSVQGNVDPVVLFAKGPESENYIEAAIDDVRAKAGGQGHVLNLGHGILTGTPEHNVEKFFAYNRSLSN